MRSCLEHLWDACGCHAEALVSGGPKPHNNFSHDRHGEPAGRSAGRTPCNRTPTFCMETLTVNDRRHLALPDSCLFAPTELQIAPSLSQNEFSRLGNALASVDQASDLWACDYAFAGQTRWGDQGLELAAAATRLSVGYLKVSARIAERFDPARRFANMTREHYRGLCCFPPEFTDEWLPTVVEKGFSARTLRALAVEAYGSDPKAGYSKSKKRNVELPETLYARLKEYSPVNKTALFIEQILADFVDNATSEQKVRIAAALSTLPRAAYRARTRRKEKKPTRAENPRPTYAERRENQLADGAPLVPFKRRSITIQLSPTCFGRNTKFYDGAAAREAAAQYSKDKGYSVESCFCESCKAFHVRPVPITPR